jgi:hypothetical protein
MRLKIILEEKQDEGSGEKRKKSRKGKCKKEVKRRLRKGQFFPGPSVHS